MALSLQTTRFTRVSIDTSAAEPDYATRGELDLTEAHTFLRDSTLTTTAPDGLIGDGEIAFVDAPASLGGSLLLRSGNTVYRFDSDVSTGSV